MKILVLGAGYVGEEVIKYFHEYDHEAYEIIATTTTPEKIPKLQPFCSKAIVLHTADTTHLHEIINLCDAIAIFVAPKNHAGYQETYKKTALAVQEALKDRKRPFYILYTSSTGVYEGFNNVYVNENLKLEGQSERSKILLETESIYQKCQNEFVQTCILRLGGIYGAERSLEQRAKRFSGKEIPVNGDGVTNHIHLSEIVSAVAFCFQHRLTGIYNLVNDDHPTREELYNSICESLQIPPPIWKPDIPAASKKGYFVDNSKMKQTGFRFFNL